MQSWMQKRWSSRCAPLLWAGSGAGEHAVPDDPRFVGQGPIAGIHAGLGALMRRGAGPWAIVLAVDMPDFEPAWLDRLCTDEAEAPRALAFDASSLFGAIVRIEPTQQLAEALLLNQERRLSQLAQRLAPRLRPPPEGAHLDALRSSMNHPEDFERWLERRGFDRV